MQIEIGLELRKPDLGRLKLRLNPSHITAVFADCGADVLKEVATAKLHVGRNMAQ